MNLVNIGLWLAGAALLVVGVRQAFDPYRRMAELDRLAENARRYEGWRGGRAAPAAGDQTTGADVMRQVLRRRVLLWGAVAVVGVALLLAGFALR